MNEPNARTDVHTSPIRIAYFGTPDYAVPSLRALHTDARYKISLVVTQPDRPAGRRHRVTASPVKIAAQELGLHVYQPVTLRSAESREPLVALRADVFVVAAYGLIFGSKTLSTPKCGCVNLHASLLPKFRGASPIAAAILRGEGETGVTLMLMDTGIDTGDVLDMAKLDILNKDTTASLSQKLGMLGAELVTARLADFAMGQLHPHPQQRDDASLTRMLTKADGQIDWNQPAEMIERQVRAMWAWPRAWTSAGESTLQIHSARVVQGSVAGEPGSVHAASGQPVVVCGSGGMELEVVQPAGGKAVPGAAWLAGLRGALPKLGPGELTVTLPPLIVET